jgi:pimeloyl-ACP methyl ester carboxylesterase
MMATVQMDTRTARVNGIEIAYDTFGNQADRPLLLIQGLSMQMIGWEESFCEQLAGRGFFVIRFDNRDVGRSTHCDGLGVPNIFKVIQAKAAGEPVKVPYRLEDMAADAAGLLDVLGIASANVAGVSMGGMIGQAMAIHCPERVRTLTSIMSSTGDPHLPPPTPAAMRTLLTPLSTRLPEYIEGSVRVWQVLSGTDEPIDAEKVRQRAARFHARGLDPFGVVRQMAAIFASGDRTLKRLSVPALVIHGKIDPLVPAACGIATAGAIPGAELMLVDNLGHNLDIVPSVWPEVIDALDRHAV